LGERLQHCGDGIQTGNAFAPNQRRKVQSVIEAESEFSDVLITTAVATLAILVVLPVFMVRGLIQMYRDKGRSSTFSSALAGSMMEIDLVVRPSVEHVIEAKHSVESHEEDTGGE
jgi:hypothetical protein